MFGTVLTMIAVRVDIFPMEELRAECRRRGGCVFCICVLIGRASLGRHCALDSDDLMCIIAKAAYRRWRQTCISCTIIV